MTRRHAKRRRYSDVLPLTTIELAATCEAVGERKRLRLMDESGYGDYVDTLTIGGCYTVTIEEEVAHVPKTYDQVKYWFAVPVPLVAEHCGMTDQQASHAMLGECFGYIEVFGHQVPVEPSVAALSKQKMTHLIEWVLDWCPAQLEIICPPPDKNWRANAERIRRERRRHVA